MASRQYIYSPGSSQYPEFAAKFGTSVPNYKGMFLRGYGYQDYVQTNGSNNGDTSTRHQSGNLGEIQGDAVRNFYGGWSGGLAFFSPLSEASDPDHRVSGIFLQSGQNGLRGEIKNLRLSPSFTTSSETMAVAVMNIYLKSSRQMPLSAEIRPANMAVKYIMKVK